MSFAGLGLEVTVLGSGTSTGVPVIGCVCDVCTSSDSKDNRLRSSILVRKDGKNILVDTSTDFRAQALRFGIEKVDAVLYTHTHADHIFGIDELRVFNLIQGGPIPCYAGKTYIKLLKAVFPYIFEKSGYPGFKPSIEPVVVSDKFHASGVEVTPVEVFHGDLKIYGYRFGDMAYITDCKSIPESSFAKLKHLKLLILGAIRYKKHRTHFNLEEALEVVALLKPRRTVLTHLSHSFGHKSLSDILPDGVEPAYDGMILS